MSKHSKLEELLEGLAVEGSVRGTGTFTIAPDQVWKGLGNAVSDFDELPRFCLRWLAGFNPRDLEVTQRGTRVSFTAHLAGPQPSERPHCDYSGKDIDLARCLGCVRQSGGSKIRLTVQGPDATFSKHSASSTYSSRATELSLRRYEPEPTNSPIW